MQGQEAASEAVKRKLEASKERAGELQRRAATAGATQPAGACFQVRAQPGFGLQSLQATLQPIQPFGVAKLHGVSLARLKLGNFCAKGGRAHIYMYLSGWDPVAASCMLGLDCVPSTGPARCATY